MCTVMKHTQTNVEINIAQKQKRKLQFPEINRFKNMLVNCNNMDCGRGIGQDHYPKMDGRENKYAYCFDE